MRSHTMKVTKMCSINQMSSFIGNKLLCGMTFVKLSLNVLYILSLQVSCASLLLQLPCSLYSCQSLPVEQYLHPSPQSELKLCVQSKFPVQTVAEVLLSCWRIAGTKVKFTIRVEPRTDFTATVVFLGHVKFQICRPTVIQILYFLLSVP